MWQEPAQSPLFKNQDIRKEIKPEPHQGQAGEPFFRSGHVSFLIYMYLQARQQTDIRSGLVRRQEILPRIVLILTGTAYHRERLTPPFRKGL